MSAPPPSNQAPGPKTPTGEWPAVLGDFELLERIGQGAMGTVFKGRQRSMDRLVAVKVLRPALAGDAAYVERFFREARAAARLSHPNIVLAITVGEDHGFYYFVMEYVQGHTVSLLLKAGPLEEHRALEMALQIARALDYAWSHERIVHRDIKPGNILITPSGAAKLADLGLAHEATIEEEGTLEAEGKIMGTPQYIAPEQIQRRADLDVRCDLYALGATLFHMVTGRPPYDGATTKSVLAKHLHEPVPDPCDLRPELGDGTAHIIGKLLAKDRDERYPDAAALVADIEAVLRGERVGPRLVAPPRIRRVPRSRSVSSASAIIGFVLVLILIVLVVVAIQNLMESDGPGGPRDGRGRNLVPPPPVDPRQAAAEKAWAEAEAYATTHAADFPGILARLREIERLYPGTPFAERASDLRRQTEVHAERKAQEAFDALVRRAEALVGETRYADAIGLFGKAPAGLESAGWRGKLAAARAAIERKAMAAFRAALARGDALAGRGDFDAAVRAYEGAGLSLPDAWRAEAAERIAAARQGKKDLGDKAKAQAEAAELGLLADLMALYRARKYDEAVEFLKGRVENAPAAYRDELTRELAEAAKLQDLWALAERGARRMIGQPFTIRGIQGELIAVKGGKLSIRSPGGLFHDEVKNATTDQILGFVLPELNSLEAPMAAARFLTAEGDMDGAEKRLAPLADKLAEAAALHARIQRLKAARKSRESPESGESKPTSSHSRDSLDSRSAIR